MITSSHMCFNYILETGVRHARKEFVIKSVPKKSWLRFWRNDSGYPWQDRREHADSIVDLVTPGSPSNYVGTGNLIVAG